MSANANYAKAVASQAQVAQKIVAEPSKSKSTYLIIILIEQFEE